MYISLQNMDYLPRFPRATEIRQQDVLKFAPTTKTVDNYPWQKAHLGSGFHQQLTVDAGGRNVVFQPVWVVPSPYYPVWRSPSNMAPCNGMHIMTVDQTANWIRGVCLRWGWLQTEAYVTSFRVNKINGSMLAHLNHEILRFDMGIRNHFHRLDLLAVIRQFFPCLDVNRGLNEPKRLSDLRTMDIKFVNVPQATATKMDGSSSTYDKFSLQRPESDKDDSLGMDSNSLQNVSLKSVSTKSDSDMECSEGKSKRSHKRKYFPLSGELQSEGILANSYWRNKLSVEKAAPWSKSFGGVHELQISKSRDANGLFTVQTEATLGRRVAAKLILTASSFNHAVMDAIRNRFLMFNFVVAIEQAGHYSCVVTFQSHVEAMRAFNCQHQIGYRLYHYEEDQCQTRMSPAVSHRYSLDSSSAGKCLNSVFPHRSESIVPSSKVVGWVPLESGQGNCQKRSIRE